MKSKIIALVAAGAIAASGLATTTAQADALRNIVGAAIGIAAAAAIVKSVNGNQVVVQRQAPARVVYLHDLPESCARREMSSTGWVRFYDGRCMQRHGWEIRHNQWRYVD